MENNNTFEPPVDTGANFGPTSDYNGYGTDADGHDIERTDLGPDYYNEQARRGAEALYAAAEKGQENEEKAAFPDWYGTEKDVKDAQHELLSEAIQDINAMHEALDKLEEKIKAEIAKAERVVAERQNPEPPTPPSGGAPAIANSVPLSSTTVKNIEDASSPAPSNETNNEPPQQYIGNGQVIYHSAEDANNSFKD